MDSAPRCRLSLSLAPHSPRATSAPMFAAAALPTCAPAFTAAPRGTARAGGRRVATATAAAAAPNPASRQATLRSQPQHSGAVSVSLGERARGVAAAGMLAAALLVTPAAFAEECQKSCEAGPSHAVPLSAEGTRW